MLQFAIIAVVVALSVAYAIHRIRKAAERDGDCGCGCQGCSKFEKCTKKDFTKNEKRGPLA